MINPFLRGGKNARTMVQLALYRIITSIERKFETEICKLFELIHNNFQHRLSPLPQSRAPNKIYLQQ